MQISIHSESSKLVQRRKIELTFLLVRAQRVVCGLGNELQSLVDVPLKLAEILVQLVGVLVSHLALNVRREILEEQIKLVRCDDAEHLVQKRTEILLHPVVLGLQLMLSLLQIVRLAFQSLLVT